MMDGHALLLWGQPKAIAPVFVLSHRAEFMASWLEAVAQPVLRCWKGTVLQAAEKRTKGVTFDAFLPQSSLVTY